MGSVNFFSRMIELTRYQESYLQNVGFYSRRVTFSNSTYDIFWPFMQGIVETTFSLRTAYRLLTDCWRSSLPSDDLYVFMITAHMRSWKNQDIGVYLNKSHCLLALCCFGCKWGEHKKGYPRYLGSTIFQTRKRCRSDDYDEMQHYLLSLWYID